MGWNVPRGRYGADALEPEEIQKLQAAPESASDHIARSCNSCRCAARERATLEPIIRSRSFPDRAMKTGTRSAPPAFSTRPRSR